MVHTIKNGAICVTIDTLGAQMQSLTAADGTTNAILPQFS